MRIEIHEHVTQQPNGDRDTRRHPSSAFKVMLINGERSARLFENNQFDNWHSHIRGTRNEYLAEARAEARHFADTMHCEVDLEPTTAPARKAELKERIARDRAELKKLEGQ